MTDQGTPTRQACNILEHCHLRTSTHHGSKTTQKLASETIWAGIQDCASKFRKCCIQKRCKISLSHFQCKRWHLNKKSEWLEDFPYRDTASFGSPWSSSPRVMSQLSCLTYRTMELLRLENTSNTLSTSCPPVWQALLDSLLCDSDFQYHKVQYWTQFSRFSLLTEGKDPFMDLPATLLLVQSRESLTSWGTKLLLLNVIGQWPGRRFKKLR